MSRIVKLGPDQVLVAAHAGAMRHALSINAGTKSRYGHPDHPWQADIEGVGAEIAVSWAINQAWGMSLSPQLEHQSDVGLGVEVRWTSHETGRLLLHDKDPVNKAFFLVRGKMPHYIIVGWCWAGDGQKEAYWDDKLPRPCYAVPGEDLAPFDLYVSESRPRCPGLRPTPQKKF